MSSQGIAYINNRAEEKNKVTCWDLLARNSTLSKHKTKVWKHRNSDHLKSSHHIWSNLNSFANVLTFVDMDLQADIPFPFSTDLVRGMTFCPYQCSWQHSWRGVDVKATSTLCYDAYSGIYLTLLLMPLEKTPAFGIITWASITGTGKKQALSELNI